MHLDSATGKTTRTLEATYYRNNVTGTLNLLDAMVQHAVKVFIFSCSASIYGMPAYTPIDEQHPKAPINPYGRSKLMVETLLSDFDARSACAAYHCATLTRPAPTRRRGSGKTMNRRRT